MITKKIYVLLMASMVSAGALADDNVNQLNMENGVIPIADDRGFTLQSNDGNFVFKPYLYLQSTLNYRYYDDEGLDKAYNQDNVANSGFAMNYASVSMRLLRVVIYSSRLGSTMPQCKSYVSV